MTKSRSSDPLLDHVSECPVCFDAVVKSAAEGLSEIPHDLYSQTTPLADKWLGLIIEEMLAASAVFGAKANDNHLMALLGILLIRATAVDLATEDEDDDVSDRIRQLELNLNADDGGPFGYGGLGD